MIGDGLLEMEGGLISYYSHDYASYFHSGPRSLRIVSSVLVVALKSWFQPQLFSRAVFFQDISVDFAVSSVLTSPCSTSLRDKLNTPH